MQAGAQSPISKENPSMSVSSVGADQKMIWGQSMSDTSTTDFTTLSEDGTALFVPCGSVSTRRPVASTAAIFGQTRKYHLELPSRRVERDKSRGSTDGARGSVPNGTTNTRLAMFQQNQNVLSKTSTQNHTVCESSARLETLLMLGFAGG